MSTIRDAQGNPVITINPGTEPVEGATYDNALDNIVALARDTNSELFQATEREEDGRWYFELRNERGVKVEVEMPGLPLDQVRYMKEEGQDIWDFPRLYVGGSSWVWLYAINAVRNSGEET